MRKTFLAAVAAVSLLAACSVVPKDTSQTIYAMDATYASLAAPAVAYITSPGANLDVVKQIKYYSQAAHDALANASTAEKLGGGNVGVAMAAAQAAIKSFSDYLTTNGVH